ncbi:hypothetical protein FQA39_LY17174 [Lamprigera yunnana]|nr:hypothetical protein FQA39_LY17174 [Lamprigera yunnana]
MKVQYWTQAIEKLSKEEKETLNLLRSQTQIVKTAITNFNNTITDLYKNKKIFQENFEIFKNFSDKTHTKITNLEITQKLDEQLAVKVLHPSVINPTQFITKLTKTINRLPSGSEYPTPMELKNADTLFDLSEINLEELKVGSHKLDDIARLSENLSKTENTSRKNSVFSIIVQIVCGILITYLIFKVVVFLINRIRNKKNPHDHNNTCNSLTNCITLTMCKNQKDRRSPNVSIELSSVADSEINTSSPRRSLRLAKLKDKKCN